MLHTTAEVFFSIAAINPDGSVAAELPTQRNLITDNGLDLIAGTPVLNLQSVVQWGTGTLVTSRSTSGVTVSAAAGVLTASAGYFVAADVGRLFKFDSGEEVRITGYTSATQVATSSSATIAATTGKMWYVNLTTLITSVGSTSTTTSDATTKDVDNITIRRKRVFLTDAFAAQKTITELAWGPSVGSLFGCKEIIPFPVLVGQQLRITLEVTASLSTALQAISAASNVGTGCDTVGTLCLETHAIGRSIGGGLEPCSDNSFAPIIVPFTQTPLQAGWFGSGNMDTLSGPDYSCAGLTQSNYTAGSCMKKVSGTYPSNRLAGTVYGVALGVYVDNGNRPFLTVKFTNPWAITLDDKLVVEFTKTWGRKLVN